MLYRQAGERSESMPRAGANNRWLALLTVAVSVCVTGVSVSSANVAGTPVAHTARALSGTVRAALHLVKPNGSLLIEEGSVSDRLHGTAWGAVNMGATFRGTFTLRVHGGSISGSGRATPRGAGRYQSFSGVFTATGGAGLYAHIHGHSGLYGVFDRRTDAVTIQTQGTLYY